MRHLRHSAAGGRALPRGLHREGAAAERPPGELGPVPVRAGGAFGSCPRECPEPRRVSGLLPETPLGYGSPGPGWVCVTVRRSAMVPQF